MNLIINLLLLTCVINSFSSEMVLTKSLNHACSKTAFNSDGTLLAIAADRTISIYDLNVNKKYSYPDHNSALSLMWLNNDVAIADPNGSIKCIDPYTGDCKDTIKIDFPRIENIKKYLWFMKASPDSNYFIYSTYPSNSSEISLCGLYDVKNRENALQWAQESQIQGCSFFENEILSWSDTQVGAINKKRQLFLTCCLESLGYNPIISCEPVPKNTNFYYREKNKSGDFCSASRIEEPTIKEKSLYPRISDTIQKHYLSKQLLASQEHSLVLTEEENNYLFIENMSTREKRYINCSNNDKYWKFSINEVAGLIALISNEKVDIYSAPALKDYAKSKKGDFKLDERR